MIFAVLRVENLGKGGEKKRVDHYGRMKTVKGGVSHGS